MKIAVTGATGYIGQQLITCIQQCGHQAIALSRKPPKTNCSWLAYDLYAEEIYLPQQADAIIHLAMNFDISSAQDIEREKQSTLRLLAAAQKSNLNFLLVSSQTASAQAATAYGKTKWELEKIVLAAGGNVARPGMVYGGELKGLFGTMTQFLARLPLAPWLIPAPQVQPIHVADLSLGLIAIVVNPVAAPRVFQLAGKEAIPFQEFMRSIARFRLDKTICLVPIPGFVINLAHVLLPQNKQLIQLRSLMTLPLMAIGNDLQDLGLNLRSLADGLFHSGDFNQRLLSREAHSLLSYLLGTKAPLYLVKRYLRAIACLQDGEPLQLAPVFYRFPWLLGCVNAGAIKNSAWRHEFSRRLDLATAIAEASPLGAAQFLRTGTTTSFFTSGLIAVKAIACELGQRILGLIVTPLLFRKSDGRHEH